MSILEVHALSCSTRPDLVVARVVGVVDCTIGIGGASVSCVVSTTSVIINR